MDSATIKAEVQKHAPSPRSIWPNGLGFNWRGWEYSYGAKGWAACSNGRVGYGETPADAKSVAFYPALA